VEEGASTVAEYAYNGLGQRVTKTLDGMTTVFHYDHSGKLIAESLPDGIITAEYLYMGKIRIAYVDVSTGTIYYYLNDRLGTPQLMTDDAGTIVWEASYKPFGEATINPRSSVVNDFRFPDQFLDQETGLHYNYFRYYDPRMGRYVRPDPLGIAGGINLYDYTADNPIDDFDRFGLARYHVYWHMVGVGFFGMGGAKITGTVISMERNCEGLYEGVEFTGFLLGVACGLPVGGTFNNEEVFEDSYAKPDPRRIEGLSWLLSGSAAFDEGFSGGAYHFGRLVGIKKDLSKIEGYDFSFDYLGGIIRAKKEILYYQHHELP